MKRVVFNNLMALVLLTALSACSNERIIPDPEPGPGTKNVGNISLKVYVPKGSISTYAEAANAAENSAVFIELPLPTDRTSPPDIVASTSKIAA
jgi:hypothetical protein